MFQVTISGGTKTQRDLVENCFYFLMQEMMPRKKKLEIDFVIRNTLVEGAAGYCMQLDPELYQIELHNRGSLYEFIATMAHEMVHLKQYVRKELIWRKGREYFHGEDVTNVAYSKQPHEREAFKLQHGLAKKFIRDQKGLNITLKRSKMLSPRTLKLMDFDKEIRLLQEHIDREKR